jgi:prepilin-type N-terminal cleavage/methylation domain-containing protein
MFNSFKKRGFTLIETVVSVGVFLVIATASYQAYLGLFTLINQNQYKIIALNLANEQFEIVRNLSYSDVGIVGGVPNGKIPHIQNLTRSNISFVVTTTIRNVDLPFDGQIGSTTNDLSPADNKLVEVEIDCPLCKNFTPISLTTRVAPKNLETASTNGALFVKVFDSNGVPVPGADVRIVNTSVIPNILIDDVTDNDGLLQVVDAPPSTDGYQITVTKDGYSTDRTYAVSVGNPSPTKPHATVIIQQLTQISFSIDRLSSITISSVTPECVAIPSMDFTLSGEKNIGVNIPKYSENLITNASGMYSSSGIEWDSYTITGIDGTYDIIGLNPLNPIGVGPNTNQNISMIVSPKNTNSLLITVKDGATQLPITDAEVRLTRGVFDETQITGRGYINQTNWSGGEGQILYSDKTRYFSDDGNIDVNNPSGEIKLKNAFGEYNASGVIESSTIDTGYTSNFYNLIWKPNDQPVNAGTGSVRFQFATNATSSTTTWAYKGPDGTSSTYYTSPNSVISQVHNGDRYARYKIFLSSQSTTTTPNISDVAFTVTSSCAPGGQVIFSGLTLGTYHVEVIKDGYITAESDIDVSSSWQENEIILTP